MLPSPAVGRKGLVRFPVMGRDRVHPSVLCFILVLGYACGDELSRDPVGAQCAINGDCDAPLVCRLERCRVECATTRDCHSTRCVLDEERIGACTVDAEDDCALDSDCPGTLVCRSARCVNQCTPVVAGMPGPSRDCAAGSLCTPADDGTWVCVETAAGQCTFDRDCEEPLVCRSGACREECHGLRDCRRGYACRFVDGSSTGVCEPVGSSVDGGVADAGSGVDGGVADAGPPLPTFGAPTMITELSDLGALDDDPTLSQDLLEIYFNSDRSGDLEIWRSTRSSVTAAWAAPTLVRELGAVGSDQTPELSADGLTMWIASRRAGGAGDHDLWVSTRATVTTPWSTPTPVTELNTASSEQSPRVLPDGLRLAFTSDWPGVPEPENTLWIASRTSSTGPWTTVEQLLGLGTPEGEIGAQLSEDLRSVVFYSDRPASAGSWDFFVAERATPAGAFGPARPIVELNSPEDDQDHWFDRTRSVVFFASRRPAGGALNLYVAEAE
jgi:hypothetical protein